jgi:hypothetical protein
MQTLWSDLQVWTHSRPAAVVTVGACTGGVGHAASEARAASKSIRT